MSQSSDIKIFRGIAPGSRSSANRDIKISVLCAECKKKFKEFLKNGHSAPEACDICKENLKNQMYVSRYPDRE